MNEIRFEQAVFLQEHRSEVEAVKEQFQMVIGMVISNTLVQMPPYHRTYTLPLANPELIDRMIEASEFVYNDDITPTSLKLIMRVAEDAQEYVGSSDFTRCKQAIRTLSALVTKMTKNESKE